MAVTFVFSATTLTPTRAYDARVPMPRSRAGATQRLLGGSMVRSDWGLEIASYRLTWTRISKADHDAFLAFWRLVGGSLELFVFTDIHAVAHTVRWVSESFDAEEIGSDAYSLTIELREEVAS